MFSFNEDSCLSWRVKYQSIVSRPVSVLYPEATDSIAKVPSY